MAAAEASYALAYPLVLATVATFPAGGRVSLIWGGDWGGVVEGGVGEHFGVARCTWRWIIGVEIW